MTPPIAFEGHIAGKHYNTSELVASTESEIQEVVNLLFTTQPEWKSNGLMIRTGSDNALGVILDPFTHYVVLEWSSGEQSFNPHPFVDANLIGVDYDNDPLNYYKRDAYISEVDARAAVWEYINTGQRPATIQWQPFGYEVYELPSWLEDLPELRERYFLISPEDPARDPYQTYRSEKFTSPQQYDPDDPWANLNFADETTL
jgi:hypothetical protein